jgi:putative spermidine/putrescine transport system permease protein
MSVSTFDIEKSSLKTRLRRAERVQRMRAVGLVLPLFLFILLVFVVPIIILMTRAVDNPEIAESMPKTMMALSDWDGADLPGEPVYAAFADDLRAAQKNKTTGLVGKRLNYEI